MAREQNSTSSEGPSLQCQHTTSLKYLSLSWTPLGVAMMCGAGTTFVSSGASAVAAQWWWTVRLCSYRSS
jgi:hypothetical protein